MTKNFSRENYIHEDSDKEFSFFHFIDRDGFTMGFHSHNSIEVYLSVSGGKHFIINDRIYNIEPGDLFVTNMSEVHRVIAEEGQVYERFVFEFKPTFALPYCTAQTDLLHYVYKRQGSFSNKVSLEKEKHRELLELIQKYENIADDSYGNDVRRRLCYIEMLTLIAEAYLSPVRPGTNASCKDSMNLIADTLAYISANLTEELSLDNISKHIGLSKYHLCKLFKANTGTTINSYIVTRRIAEAKYLLAAGESVTSACHGSGFNDISHFTRTFHRLVGISPGKFSSEMMYESTYYKGAEN